MSKLIFSKHVLPTALIATALLLSNSAQANWTFDGEQCSPLTQHEVQQKMPPAVMLMVDRSGSMLGTKWTIAKSAVDTVTKNMTQSEPDQLEFGFGMYAGSVGTIYHEAAPNANSRIMNTMNGLSPSGGTPTAEAIQKMYQSATVKGTVVSQPYYQSIGYFPRSHFISIPDSYGTNERLEGIGCGLLWLQSCYVYDQILPGEWKTSTINITQSKTFHRLKFDVSVTNARGLYDYDIELRHNSGPWVRLLTAQHSPDNVSSWSQKDVAGFNGQNMQGTWTLRIRDNAINRGSRDRIVDSSGNLNSWALRFEEKINVDTSNRATAGILITDGYPNHAQNAVTQACLHRNIAPLYMVGLGTGTDTDFNNILAAAGGTGSCTNGDVCANPSNYSQFRNKCTGSYQADNSAALTAALTSITSAISCTYPLSVLGGGEVPPSNAGCKDYDCVYVSLNGGVGRIYHESSAKAPKGWTWASQTERKLVKLNDHYCGMVQNGTTRIIDTQVACLCSQPFDARCDVYDPDTCECPVGRWACHYGTDVCEPSTGSSCNVPRIGEGQTCSNGKLGICEEFGQTVCDGSGRLTCNAGPGPAPRTETCNGLDDNCNGIVDDVDWEGIAACHVDFGRSKTAIQQETNRCMVGHASCVNGQEICIPLSPMPEICNGLDDDCDEQIDNLSGSHVRYNEDLRFTPDGDYELAPPRPPLTDAYEGAACFERDACSCLTGTADISSPEYMSDDYDTYLETYWRTDSSGNPICHCSSGLSR